LYGCQDVSAGLDHAGIPCFAGKREGMPRRPPEDRWQDRYYKDTWDRLRELSDRRRMTAAHFGVRVDTLSAFEDLSHLSLEYPLQNKRSGRKWRREPVRKVTSWRWKEV